MQSKWIPSSSQRDSNSNPRMRPGAFSNQTSLFKQPPEPQGMRPGRAYHFQGHKRSQEKHVANTSFEALNKVPHYMNSDNEIFTSLGDSQIPTAYSEHQNIQHNISSQPLAEHNNNKPYARESRSQPNSNTAKPNTNEKPNRGFDENSSKQREQGTYAKIIQNSQAALNKNKENRDKSPGGYAKKRLSAGTTSRKTARPNVNDENSNELNQPKVGRSHSTLLLSAAESKSQGKNSHYKSSEAFFVQEQDGESVLKASRDNSEGIKTINRLTAELQNEKKRCAVLEAEVENYKNDLVKEREKYKEELCKISQQIKKLRNIQNIYVTEKKNSEKLENQLNIKEKAVNDISYLLCESLKAIMSVLELVLLKGDVALDKHWKARDFSPEMMFKLFNDIRKLLLPKVEEAESYNLDFEWKCHDYKDIVTNTKEFLKLRKAHSSKNLNPQKDEFVYKESKSSYVAPPSHNMSNNNHENMNNTIFSPVFAQAENHPLMNKNPVYEMPKKSTEPDSFKSKSVQESNQRERPGSKSLNELQAQLQKINDYVPLHTRLSLAEIKMQEDMQNEENNNVDNKSIEQIQEDRCVKKRASSVSKYWEGDPNIGENFIPGSLGSTIVPRTNNCSGFAENFENFLGDNVNSKINSEDRRLNSANTSKNYDLPMSISNMANMAKNSSELEMAKNKILKRKQSIEARRVSSIHYDPNFLLEQPGIAENSEESMTSFQKTLEDDSLQKQSLPEKVVSQPPPQNYQQGPTLRSVNQNQMKVSTQALSDKANEPKDVKSNVSAGKEDLPLRLTRSNSTVAASTDDRPSARSHSMKKDHSQRSLTHDSQKERTQVTRDENSEGNNRSARTQGEQFVIAKFDYNAQKDNDLSFSKGDKIKILRKNENGWWIGLSNNKIGYFPPNLVENTE